MYSVNLSYLKVACRLTSEDDGLLHIAEALQTNSSLTKNSVFVAWN